MAIVDHHDASLRVRPPRRCVEQRPQRYRIVVAEHEEERGPVGTQALVGKLEPGGEPLLHEACEEALETAVRLERLDLTWLGAVRVVAVILDQPLQGLEVGPFLHAVLGADEAAAPSAPGLSHDRLDRLSGDVAAQDQDVGAVDRRGVDELAEALRRTVEIGHEEDAGRAGHRSSGAGRQR